MNFRLTLALTLLAPIIGLTAATSLDQAQARLHSAIDEVLALADKAKDRATLVARIGPVLQKHISFEAMTRRAIGPGWRAFTADQQKKAISLFSQLIIRSYSNKFTIGEHPEISYKSASAPASGRVDVTTTTTYQGSRYNVIYRMEESEGWRTTDVVIEGVSMVANYRSQLDPVYKRGGADAVLNSLTQSVANPQ
ncbi:MAG: ABC transporter substrate-binding protein [Verrucomicrobiales bacterium]|nr:ABC transporter substrate-binding protein [Verrucomicrobiales bacterium]MCP5558417.1 ABC transporter substrate-binding protein [Verrucomicrobiaceae bacterium]